MSIKLSDFTELAKLQSIAAMAYGSGHFEKSSGGEGNIGILNGRVIKWNTHLSERNAEEKRIKNDNYANSESYKQQQKASKEMINTLISIIKRTVTTDKIPTVLKEFGFLGDVTKELSDEDFEKLNKPILSRKCVARVINKVIENSFESRINNGYIWGYVEDIKQCNPGLMGSDKDMSFKAVFEKETGNNAGISDKPPTEPAKSVVSSEDNDFCLLNDNGRSIKPPTEPAKSVVTSEDNDFNLLNDNGKSINKGNEQIKNPISDVAQVFLDGKKGYQIKNKGAGGDNCFFASILDLNQAKKMGFHQPKTLRVEKAGQGTVESDDFIKEVKNFRKGSVESIKNNFSKLNLTKDQLTSIKQSIANNYSRNFMIDANILVGFVDFAFDALLNSKSDMATNNAAVDLFFAAIMADHMNRPIVIVVEEDIENTFFAGRYEFDFSLKLNNDKTGIVGTKLTGDPIYINYDGKHYEGIEIEGAQVNG